MSVLESDNRCGETSGSVLGVGGGPSEGGEQSRASLTSQYEQPVGGEGVRRGHRGKSQGKGSELGTHLACLKNQGGHYIRQVSLE